MENQTAVTYFVLLGFSDNLLVQIFLFLMFLFIYTTTLLGNMTVMAVIRKNNNLRSPMYFFLSHLSFLDICFSSATVPKGLINFFSSHTISYNGCIAQIFFIIMTGCTELYILAVMAFDRYVAICKPLHYVQIMNRVFCRWLVGSTWTIGFIQALVNTLPLFKLMFCGQNVIRHFSCEQPSLLALSCTNIYTNRIILSITGNAVGISSFLFISVSYLHIFSTVRKMHSAEAKRRTFSTCTPHLIVLGLYYSSTWLRYMKPESMSSRVLDAILSIQYSICTPMLNPIIYSLKSRDVKEAIKELIGYKE
ncbi:olfactory receptor 2D3-like, partial [Heteronotia binoei]|uniref:olfactory receptor 2D3-like n=1 Tax=Heteronotia binoei TaxID=13085 RepID=UPI00292FFC35